MSWYLVDVTCRCGQVHGLAHQVQIEAGLHFGRRAGTVAELYPSAASPGPSYSAALFAAAQRSGPAASCRVRCGT